MQKKGREPKKKSNARKINRDLVKCQRYRDSGNRRRNWERRLARHMNLNPNDRVAQSALSKGIRERSGRKKSPSFHGIIAAGVTIQMFAAR